MGLFPAANYMVESTKLNKGDLIFTYTDGVNEAKNLDGQQFTDERILKVAATEGNNTEAFLRIMFEAVCEFRGKAEQSDDITMLALKYLPPTPTD
jgi:sigma-B regulation protein RsbU (phosphoserine phosphatase)